MPLEVKENKWRSKRCLEKETKRKNCCIYLFLLHERVEVVAMEKGGAAAAFHEMEKTEGVKR